METFGDVKILLLFSILLIAILSIFIIRLLSNKRKEQIDALGRENQLLQTEILQERSLLSEKKLQNLQLEKELSVLTTDNKNLKLHFEQQKNNDKEMQEKFENLANKILDQKSKSFDMQQQKGISLLLNPLKEKIEKFETKIDKTHLASIEKHVALKEQITLLSQMNKKISDETINLTKALKGDNKQQGNWGEMILESILSKSGLEKDREYTLQQNCKTPVGEKDKRPDVIIHLPKNKKLIIDAKVSLRAYESFVNEEDEEKRMQSLKAHCLSIQKHIDELSQKAYHEIYTMASPDFVLLFIPIDQAFSSSLKLRPDFYQYAFDKNIVIVTPATLLASLKTVETMWRNEKQQKHAIEIAIEAGKMYDKFAAFVDDMNHLGVRIDQTKNAWDNSMKKLSNGKGDLLSRAEKLKTLGAKANKKIALKN